MKWGRSLAASIIRIALAADPRAPYRAMYFAKVVAFNKLRQEVDLVPDDPLLPTMAGIRVRGLAGALLDLNDPKTGNVPDGLTALVGWENADPSRAFAIAFRDGRVPQLVLNADQIYLGGTDGAEPAAKGQTLQTFLDSLTKALVEHFHPASSGTTSPSAQLADLEAPNVLAIAAKVQ